MTNRRVDLLFRRRIAVGMGAGTILGIVLGAALGNIALGLAIGIIIGGVGAAFRVKKIVD